VPDISKTKAGGFMREIAESTIGKKLRLHLTIKILFLLFPISLIEDFCAII
jgi:hypothetical protein